MQQKNNKLETVQCKKPRKWNVIKELFSNNLSKSQVFVAHGFWVICRCFTHFCRALNGGPILVHRFGTGNQQKHLEFTFSLTALFFTRELAYVRINMSSNTSNGYTAENQEERLFLNETAFLFWCHALLKLGSSSYCIFKMNHATGMKTCTKIYFLSIFNLV